MTPDDPTAAFATVLRRFQRRLRLGAFLRHVTITSAIVLVAIDVVVLAGRQGGAGVVAFGGAVLVAIVAAYGLAVRSVPSLSAAARIVDRELRLQDRTISALAFSSTTDPVASLVVADATARLQTLPVSRLPLAVPAWARWLAVSTFAVSALILVALARTTSDVSSLSDASMATSHGRAAGDAARRTEGSATRSVPPGTGNILNDGRDTASAPSARAGIPEGPATTTGRRSAEAAADRSNSTAPERDAGNRTRDPLTPPPLRSGAATGLGASAAGGRAPGNAAQGSSSSLSAPGRGASAPAADRSAGGGAGGGALVSESRATESRSATSASRRTAAYSAAGARAESATSTERVPARLRSYVRAYFLAIRADQWR